MSIINSTFIQFESKNPAEDNQYAVDIINFVFATSCNSTHPFLLALNDTCHITCPSSYFGNTNTSTCDNCSSECLTCNLNATNCLSCHTDRYYPNSTTCSLCPDTCQQCTSATNCIMCINGSYILRNSSCVVDCSSISNCIDCELGPICKNCSSYYQLSGNACVSICADGVLLSGEQCDDNNTNSNDGCSSNCTL